MGRGRRRSGGRVGNKAGRFEEEYGGGRGERMARNKKRELE